MDRAFLISDDFIQIFVSPHICVSCLSMFSINSVNVKLVVDNNQHYTTMVKKRRVFCSLTGCITDGF